MKTLDAERRTGSYNQRQPIRGGECGVIPTLPVPRGRHDINGVSLARLLIVDDDGDQVATICRLLRTQGYSATGATSGADALDVLRATRADDVQFDILVTDLMMPVMDGAVRLAHRPDDRARAGCDRRIDSIRETRGRRSARQGYYAWRHHSGR
jgi:PleD family two-component response regulator